MYLLNKVSHSCSSISSHVTCDRKTDGFKKRSLSLLIIASLSLGFGACGSDRSSDISHRDNPESRGGFQEMPWHFHTGQGFVVTDFRDDVSGNNVRLRSTCDLSLNDAFTDPDCREKVYYFTRAEIMGYINTAKKLYDADLNTATAASMAASTVAVVSAKTAFAGLVAPDPTVVTSKLIAVGAAVGAGIAGIVVAWQGKKIVEILSLMGKLDDLLKEEELFVARCGHVRKNFLSEAEKLGVTIVFPKAGGDFIPGSEYLSSLAEEKILYKKTLNYAEKNRITSQRAYQEFFIAQCGQLPTVQTSQNSELFSVDWKYIPENLKQATLKASDVIALNNNSIIEFGKFDSNDFESRSAQEGVLSFLASFKKRISSMDRLADPRLEKFRGSIEKIIIQPVWKGWSLFSDSETYKIRTFEGKKYLFLNALWSWNSGKIEISVDDYFDHEF